MHELEIPADIIKVPVSKIDVTELTVHELTEDNSKWESGSINDISFKEVEKIIDGFERTSSIEDAYGINFGYTVNGISSVYDYEPNDHHTGHASFGKHGLFVFNLRKRN
uniref:Uncharacterized protein n=1 Tax=Erwinia amylovora ATCC BAA-2158 TaxID=889211 RepID=E5B162_ERWAM|nr:hypothetical protein EAIL5_0393 [Erwinia amylovora ATCC BAA-2158]